MRNPDLLPERDDAFAIFASNFTEKAAAHHASWQIPEHEITALSAANEHFQTCWEIARNKNNRTSMQVRAKQDARKTLESVLRPFINRFIRYNSIVTAEERVMLNMKPRKTTRTRVSSPDTSPMLSISTGSGFATVLHCRQEPDAAGCSRRAMPEGVTRIELAISVGVKPLSADDCTALRTASRSPVRIERMPAHQGKEIFLFSRWVNTRGEAGPWSQLYSFVMA